MGFIFFPRFLKNCQQKICTKWKKLWATSLKRDESVVKLEDFTLTRSETLHSLVGSDKCYSNVRHNTILALVLFKCPNEAWLYDRELSLTTLWNQCRLLELIHCNIGFAVPLWHVKICPVKKRNRFFLAQCQLPLSSKRIIKNTWKCFLNVSTEALWELKDHWFVFSSNKLILLPMKHKHSPT